MKVKHLLSTVLLSLAALPIIAQQVFPAVNSPQYQSMKEAGTLPQPFMGNPGGQNMLNKIQPIIQPGNSVQAATSCNCLQTIDNTYSVAQFQGYSAPDYRNDDASTANIPLPFNFCLYGTNYNSCWINNNGNISFDAAYTTFSSSGFPSSSYVMVAPFWADVDTRNLASGLVYYKITPTAMIVRWQNVGYFNSQADKINDFQLIITDGTDPIIPLGSNVSFCYGDMQWTTGSASGGLNGFGGTPATVGANKGDGTNFLQFGRFDVAGIAYDGPGGTNDGVSWLDNQSFFFNVCTNNNNIAPIVSGINVCDTLTLCIGESLPLNFSFLTPEIGQNITTTINSNGVPGFTGTATSGTTSVITANFTASLQNVGYNTITFVGTDDGTPNASTTVTIVINVIDVPQPVISGTGYFCTGSADTLSVDSLYDTFTWTPGGIADTTNTYIVTQPGTYTATVTIQGCTLDTTFTVAQGNPIANIQNNAPFCDGECITLDAGTGFTNYDWTVNGVADSSQTVTICDTTALTLIVTDQYGCTDTTSAQAFSLPKPVAAFVTNPPTPGFIGQPVQITDQSTTPQGSTLTAWDWNIPNGLPSTSTDQNPLVLYGDISDSTITLIVTNSSGCTDTLTLIFEAIPANIPNVFTPNGDGINETFVIPKALVIENCKLIVWNRWGKVVYRTDNYKNDWDGEKHSDGVYYFVFTEPDGKGASGTVTILRGK
ncbi:MAG: gliding motility-associated C-terminal domain-containing protein [Sphingobacteriales bacterium JAD_PAG50586_3]|nr:MAG: gliding motility-associated C-terminal domain-containing protein [Sphingobacteriales bacterium JAD_PAG50586_3]